MRIGENNQMKRKWLAVGIILLFIGVTVAPSINQSIVTASQEDDLVEVTTQACGIQGYGDTTVKLTRQQYQNLEEYLVEFRARLNQTTTREEAIPIFKDAVVELDRYGLLPRGMSVEQAQNLVIISNQIEKIVSKLHQQIFRDPIQTNDTQNKFCFVVCYTKDLEYYINIAMAFLLMFFFAILYISVSFSSMLLLLIATTMFEILGGYCFVKPFVLISMIDISSVASFFSIGLQGVKQGTSYLQGIYGFTGLHIIPNLPSKENLFIGSAILVK
jgi:hypothetical protein